MFNHWHPSCCMLVLQQQVSTSKQSIARVRVLPLGAVRTCSQTGHRSFMRRGPSIKLWLVSRAVQYISASMQQCTVGPSPAGTASGLNACCRSSCAHLYRQLSLGVQITACQQSLKLADESRWGDRAGGRVGKGGM